MLIILFGAVVFIPSCRHKSQVAVVTPDGNYPDSIARILVTKCTNPGCHNQASYQNAGQLLLDTWDHLFQGGVSGAVVVAYSVQYSPLLYYVCPDASLGFTVSDLGHIPAPITTAEYLTLANWVAQGAPDKNGTIPFGSDPSTRQKIYLTQQQDNDALMTVIDAKSRLVMREIPIGDLLNQGPHDVEISSDGRYAYVPFYIGYDVIKMDVTTDTVVGYINAGNSASVGSGGGWSIIYLSPSDTSFLVSAWLGNCILNVNSASMQLTRNKSIGTWDGGGALSTVIQSPHGLAANTTFDTFYATLATSLIKYTFDNTGLPEILDTIAASGQPHQIEMSPDNTKYFVTCPDSDPASIDYVRVYDKHNDSLIKAIPVGKTPQEMDVSLSKNYLFVDCMEDATNPRPNCHGSVYVFDMTTLNIVQILYGDFYQPHDIAVDEQDSIIVIPSRNANIYGPAPHHLIGGSGRPGWYTVYNLNTLQPESNKRYEVPQDPYAISTRFK